MLRWIVEAGDKVSTDIIIQSFKKPGISNVLDGSEDDMTLLNDVSDDADEKLTFPDFTAEETEQAASVAAAVSAEAVLKGL